MTVLQPASITPEPTNRCCFAEKRIVHPNGVVGEVVGLVADLFGQIRIRHADRA